MDFPGTVEEAARLAAGNWQEFDSFSWHRGFDLEDADQRFIYYTEHRDSGLLDQSNSEQIRQTLEPFTNGDDPDVVEESHRHWAVGYIEGYSIRVYRDGQITEAFRTLYKWKVSDQPRPRWAGHGRENNTIPRKAEGETMAAPAALHDSRDNCIRATNMPKEHHDSCRKAMDRLWEEHHPDGADLFSDPDPDDWCTVFGFVCGYAACLEDQNTREKAETIEKPKDIGID